MSPADDPDTPENGHGTLTEHLAAWYEDDPGRFWVYVTGGPLLLLLLGIFLVPDLVWGSFLWENLWGPIVSDAHGQPMCSAGPGQWSPAPCETGEVVARAGYTVTSYAVYGPVLLVALFGLKEFLSRFGIDVDERFMVTLAPLIVFGSMLRVMEDANLFRPPSQYLFISPLIYFVLAAIAVGALGLGLAAQAVRERRSMPAGLTVLAVPAILTIGLHAVLDAGIWSIGLNFVPPTAVGAFAVLVGFGVPAVDAWQRDRIDPTVVGFGVGVASLLMVIYLSAVWILGAPWSTAGIGRTFATDVLPATLGGAVLITAAVTAAMWVLHRRGASRASVFLTGVAVAMLFGHALDAWATTMALENPLAIAGVGTYSEKHPASNFLIQDLGWPIWIAVKVGLVLAIVWMFEVEYEEDFEDQTVLAGMLKLAIIVLGLGPGIRDVVRVTLGV